MDFLDPAKKRAHKIQLFIGHTLMGVLVLIGTYILVYQAYGFDVDRDTGEVFQNGLVFIDSAPDGAEIKLNGDVHKNQTNNRLALPEGHYDLEINKEGYRTWRKSFDLEGGKIERFVYPTLFLNDLNSSDQQTVNAPSFVTQSPDRRWVLIGEENKLSSFIEYDLNTLEDEKPVSRTFTLPQELFTSGRGNHRLDLVEWSTDNTNLLVQHYFSGGSEFVVINRDKAEESFNVNKLLGQNPSKVLLKDKKIDQLFVYSSKTKLLSQVAVEGPTTEKIAEDVMAFEPHGNDVVAMVVHTSDNTKKAQVFIREGEQEFQVREMVANSEVKLVIASYDNDWYLAVYDPGDQRTYIYRNPTEFIKRNPGLHPPPIMVLNNIGTVNEVEFSQNTQFISARSGQHFAVYDNEYSRSFRFDVKSPFDKSTEVVWMDGHRFLAFSKRKIIVFEFDGQNQQTLIGAYGGLPVAFNRDYTELYAIQKAKNKKPAFTQTFLRLEEDR